MGPQGLHYGRHGAPTDRYKAEGTLRGYGVLTG